MPARYTSARFVGRDDTFTRLASVLQGAAVGEAGALLIGGTAGVGASRFVDEAVRRVGGLQEPMLVLRGGAHGPGTDRPYGAFIRRSDRRSPSCRTASSTRSWAPRATRSSACCRSSPSGSGTVQDRA